MGKHPTAEVAVRINKVPHASSHAPDSLPLRDDLASFAGISDKLDAIVIPKVSLDGILETINYINQEFER
jgi:hypothetical protein